MKFLLATLLTAAFAFLAGMFLPWWSIAIVAFLVALLMKQNIGAGFLAGFAGIFIMWALYATVIDVKNDNFLSHQIAKLLPLGGSSILLVFVTALVGGLVGGFAAMTGSALHKEKRRRR